MYRKLMEHDRGMRLLIVYLFAYALYTFISFSHSIYQIYLPIWESTNTPDPSPGEPGFFSSSGNDFSFWPILFSILPVMLITLIPALAGGIGLLKGKAWGWWIASIHFTSSLLIGLPSLIFQLFIIRVPPNREPIYLSQPLLFVRGFFVLMIAGVAIRFLLRISVRQRLHVDGDKSGNKIAALIGLSLLLYSLIFVPTLLSMLLRLL